MRIVNVSGKEESPSPLDTSYVLVSSSEMAALVNEKANLEVGCDDYGVALNSLTPYPTLDAAIEYCKKECILNMYIARVEIVAKTV